MENRIVKFKSKESAGLNLHAIPGHFATSHSHSAACGHAISGC